MLSTPIPAWLFCFLMVALPPYLQAQTAKEIYQKSSEKGIPGDTEMISTLTITDSKKRQRVRKMASARKNEGGTRKMILQFLEPPEVKGTAILIFDYEDKTDESWIYMPSLHKVRRISGSEQGSSFMGSEFTHADMSKPNLADFTYQRWEDETIDGKDYYVLDMQCQGTNLARDLGYRSKRVWIDKKTWLTRWIRYYDTSGKWIKLQTLADYVPLEKGKMVAQSLEMENLVNGRKSFLHIDQIQSGCSLSAFDFSPEKLKQP